MSPVADGTHLPESGSHESKLPEYARLRRHSIDSSISDVVLATCGCSFSPAPETQLRNVVRVAFPHLEVVGAAGSRAAPSPVQKFAITSSAGTAAGRSRGTRAARSATRGRAPGRRGTPRSCCRPVAGWRKGMPRSCAALLATKMRKTTCSGRERVMCGAAM